MAQNLRYRHCDNYYVFVSFMFMIVFLFSVQTNAAPSRTTIIGFPSNHNIGYHLRRHDDSSIAFVSSSLLSDKSSIMRIKQSRMYHNACFNTKSSLPSQRIITIPTTLLLMNNNKMNDNEMNVDASTMLEDDHDDDSTMNNDEYDEDNDSDDVELIISTVQIKILRKEADKRRNVNRLPQFLLPIHIGEKMNLKHLVHIDNRHNQQSNSNNDKSSSKEKMSIDETIESIGQLLYNNELIEIRGISIHDNRNVNKVVSQLIDALYQYIEKPVVSIETRGYRTVLYSPYTDIENENTNNDSIKKEPKIQLYTSYKQNQWSKRPKQKRDYRGQIIKE